MLFIKMTALAHARQNLREGKCLRLFGFLIHPGDIAGAQ